MNKSFTLVAITTILILTISLAETFPSRAYAASEETHVPLWIKNVAKWWANGEITDADFSQGIQYLLAKKIIKIPETKVGSNPSPEIPIWIKIDAKWWSEDTLGDSAFIQGIQYLIQNGIINLPSIQVQNQTTEMPGNAVIWFAPLPEKVGNQFVHTKNFKPLEVEQQVIGSRDFMKLFDEGSNSWKNAGQHVQVFKLYQNWVINATDLELKQTVTYLNNHNITIALESGPLEYVSACGQGVEGFGGKKFTLYALNRIQEAGGVVHFIALDEPFYFGSLYNGKNACHWSILKVAEDVNTYVQSIKLSYPDIAIGDIEPIKRGIGVIQYENWLKIYSAVSGYNFPFFHLDGGWDQPGWTMVDKEIEVFLHAHKIQVGIIYFGNPDDRSDDEWLAHAQERMVTFEAEAGGRPNHVIFQSWDDHPNYVLPETSPHTFTHLILSYVKTRSILNIVSSQSLDGLEINGSLTQVDGKPIPKASIQLFTSFLNESRIFIESDTVPVNSTKTDMNGTFDFNLKGIKSGIVLQAKYSGDENHWPSYSEINHYENR